MNSPTSVIADESRLLQLHELECAYLRAQSAQREAQACADVEGEADAWLALSNAQIAISEIRAALASAKRAAELYCRLGDLPGQVRALTATAYTATLLRRNTEALETAFLGAKLNDQLPNGPSRVASYTYLGVSLLWTYNYARADQVLKAAIWLADELEEVKVAVHPRVNRACAEVLYQLARRAQKNQAPRVTRLAGLIEDYQRLVEPVPALAHEETDSLALVLADWCAALCAVWADDVDLAKTYAQRCGSRTAQLPKPTWHSAMALWARAEISWHEQDWPAAEAYIQDFVTQAEACENEQLVAQGYLVQNQIFAAQQKYDQAHRSLCWLRSRDLAVQREIVDHAEELAAIRLDLILNTHSSCVAGVEGRG